MSYNKQYQENSHLFGHSYPKFELFIAKHCNGGKALDLGCSQGLDAVMLDKKDFKMTAIDDSITGVE